LSGPTNLIRCAVSSSHLSQRLLVASSGVAIVCLTPFSSYLIQDFHRRRQVRAEESAVSKGAGCKAKRELKGRLNAALSVRLFIEVKYNGRAWGKTDASAPDGLRILMSLIRARLKGGSEMGFLPDS
jgi:hypothetical protein